MGCPALVWQRRGESSGVLDALWLCEPHMDTCCVDQLESHHDTQLRLCRSRLRGFGAFPRQESLPRGQRYRPEDEQGPRDCGCGATRRVGDRNQNTVLCVSRVSNPRTVTQLTGIDRHGSPVSKKETSGGDDNKIIEMLLGI